MKYVGLPTLDELIEWLESHDVKLLKITGGHDAWTVLYDDGPGDDGKSLWVLGQGLPVYKSR